MIKWKEIIKHYFLTFVVFVVLSLSIPHNTLQAKSLKSKGPNFIFIFADDLGWGDLGCYGHNRIKTPNIDYLASEGVLFTHAYVTSGVCSPSRVSVMTGQYPARHRIHGHIAASERNEARGMPNFLDPKVYTITRLLKENGYRTGHFGKWHLGGPGDKTAPLPKEYGIDVSATKVSNEPNFMKGHTTDESTELIINNTIKFIEENHDKPFYINVWLNDPHTILDPTEEQMKPYDYLKPVGKFGKKYKGVMVVYFSVVTNIDKHVGRLLKKLDEHNLTKNTIVVFTSDNGPEIPYLRNAAHSSAGTPGLFRGCKRSIYEGGIRVPFIVRWPKGCKNPGIVNDTTIISTVDLLPTFCSLAKVKIPEDLELDGEDMSGAFKGKIIQRTKPLMWEWRERILGHPINYSPMLAIREGEWKLLMNPDYSRVELYNLIADSMEVDNVKDMNPEVVKRLSEKVLKWQKTLPRGPIDSLAGKNEYRNYPKSRFYIFR